MNKMKAYFVQMTNHIFEKQQILLSDWIGKEDRELSIPSIWD